LDPVYVDVDSIVCCFSSLAAYQPVAPFDVSVSGPCTPCVCVKMLSGIFRTSRKCKFECCIQTYNYCLFVCIICFLGYDHIEFSLGGDPALPIRVLVSVRKASGKDGSSSDTSDDDDVADIAIDYRKRFIEMIFIPALSKLGCRSLSRMKGAVNSSAKKLHIHPSDWAKVAHEATSTCTGTTSVSSNFVLFFFLQFVQSSIYVLG